MTNGPSGIKARREEDVKTICAEAKKDIANLSKQSYLIAGSMMYWAEGSKTKGLAITNSDPNIIVFMVEWFKDICNIPISNLQVHLHIHDKSQDERIKRYWSKLTGIPLKNFGKSYIKPSGTGHRKNKLTNGIARIRVTGKGGTDLRYKILSWAEKVYELKSNRP